MSALFSPTALVVPFENLRMDDVESVGGKNASLGEMISQLPSGVRVPTGFATTAHAFRQFLAHDGLADKISARLAKLDTEDVRALAAAGAEIRGMVEAQPFPADLQQAIAEAFAAAHPDFEMLDAGELLEQLKVQEARSLCSGGASGSVYLRMWPHLHQTDGFFAAIWSKKA